MIQSYKITSIATDPIYIGTGGFTIGRVDNTIVRDPITRIPKIPGTSLAGTWRYYMTLELMGKFHIKEKKDRRKEQPITDILDGTGWYQFDGNRYASIQCAGQDEPNESMSENTRGHCGKCIVCKTFGYSKTKSNHKDEQTSSQGMFFSSDLNIVFFPVFTRLGTRWITSPQLLESVEIKSCVQPSKEEILSNESFDFLNLGWLNLKKEKSINLQQEDKNRLVSLQLPFHINQIIIVPDDLIHEIINANLEVRTSVSIEPTTGAAKDGALFTSEAIPRGTVFNGTVRIFDKTNIQKDIPTIDIILNALNDSKKYYETMGIGGMTTRGFGRMKVSNLEEESNG